jgi:hypothetical protein
MKTTPVLYSAAVAAGLVIGGSAWAQHGVAAGSESGDTDKPPMQAQQLASLFPKDSFQPRTADTGKTKIDGAYRYDKAGVNCSLYPARCRGEDY